MIIKKAMLPDGKSVSVTNEHAANDLIFVCEHASNYVPDGLNNLGLDDQLIQSHIAWDPGALKVAQLLSKKFNAPLVAATVSRLVYDCNRPPFSLGAIARESEIYSIPGNQNISAKEELSRIVEIYEPFCSAIDRIVDAHLQKPVLPLFVTIHSFVPVYKGIPRRVEVGVLHDTDQRIADCFLSEAENMGSYVALRNEPYAPVDGVTHTLQARAIPHGLGNVMIEIRNDLISDQEGIEKMATYLEKILRACVKECQFPNPTYKKAQS